MLALPSGAQTASAVSAHPAARAGGGIMTLDPSAAARYLGLHQIRHEGRSHYVS